MKTTAATADKASAIQRSSPVLGKSAGDTFFAPTKTATPFFAPAGIQAKLSVGQAGDKYEQEADAMADKVMRMPQNGPVLQRKCAACEHDESPKIQKVERAQTGSRFLMRKGGGDEAVSDSFEAKLNGTKGQGSALSGDTQQFMGNAFGNDFSSVRVHTGEQAVQMNQSLNARAFTHGSDVYFNQGEYSPQSSDGKHLLAHELTHVVQQNGSVQKQIQKQSIRNPLFPCYETSLLAGGTAFMGTWIHMMIQQRYVSNIDGMAATEYIIPGSGAVGGNGRADIVSAIGGVYEIKPFGLVTQALTEALQYVALASKHCDPAINWHLGTVYFPYRFVLGDEVIFSWLFGPGVIAYTRTKIPKVPVPVPKTVTDHIKEFVKKVVNEGVDATKAAEELLNQHPEIAKTILVLGVVGIIALLADDATGVGVADDVAIPPIAILMRVAWRFAF